MPGACATGLLSGARRSRGTGSPSPARIVGIAREAGAARIGREKFGDWPVMLDRFAALAEEE